MAHPLQSRRAQYITVDGKPLVIFCSNDYLGLSHHPEVINSIKEASELFGAGTGGAPGTSGTTSLHVELANEIAEFKHRNKGVIFPSGYAANTALHQSLGGADTVFFSDEKNHPSAADGIRLSGCQKHVYHHLDLSHLEQLLKNSKQARKIVTTCSVFTIDGAICPLDKIVKLKRKYNFILVLDEAHATGCIGKTGGGLEELYALEETADFIMGTFSKALGSQGGFLAFSDDSEQLMSKPLRSHEYSTSIAAPSAAASLTALKILKREPELVLKMRANAKEIYDSLKHTGFDLNPPDRHILNVYFKDRQVTMQVIERMRENGYFVVSVNLDNRWGLRVTAMSVHTDKEIDSFCKSLLEIKNKL